MAYQNKQEASKYQRYGNIERAMYIDGNTVRQTEVAPKRREPEMDPQKRRYREIRRRQKENPIKMPGIHPATLILLGLALLATLYICYTYVQVQNDVYTKKNTIVNLESSIATSKENNDIAYQDVVDSVDLSEVYAKATKELGMVQAKKDQIFTYANKKSDTVKQYRKIPGVN